MAKKKTSSSPSSKKGTAKAGRKIYPLMGGATLGLAGDVASQLKNGLSRFSFHATESSISTPSLLAPRGIARGAPDLTDMSAEAAAQIYLRGALASSSLPAFTAPEVNGEPSGFKSLGTEKVPLTGTQAVKFRQTYNKIPVYGSLVTVELDDENELVTINSSIGDPSNIDPIASVSPATILKKVKDLSGYTVERLDATPRVHYYFDSLANRWRLVYIIEDVVKLNAPAGSADTQGHDPLPLVVDYVIDAHSGELVKELHRAVTATNTENAKDGLGEVREIRINQDANGKQLVDAILGVRTCDFNFRSIRSNSLPGKVIVNPPTPWDQGAVSAHANAAVVMRFLRTVLHRNGIDNQAREVVSSINCLDPIRADRIWRNAAWFRGQMVYGQQKVGATMRSFAVGLDVVAHEIFHGVTEHTSRLEYVTMSGALNESYSDIFGVIISNFEESDVTNWNWEIGEELDGNGVPLRDLSQPSRFGQPEHMDDFLSAPPPFGPSNDFGHVHSNSGIHNLAAFRVLTAKDSSGGFLFDATTGSVIFYVALTQHLSARSTFSDSRRAVELAARSLFRNDPVPLRQAKVAAVSQAFERVGILSDD